ncbi:MAG: TonB-dependent receptor [Sphingobium sp.]|nr:TonB-dependent receptor [Sphingobium sp.]
MIAAVSTSSAQEAQNEGGPAAGDIVVIGTQIKGLKASGALPVSTIGEEQIKGVAAVSGADLFRSIPQLGASAFTEQAIGGSSPNAARGDVSSISLRGMGQGNTLLLINGRRTVLHPTTQSLSGAIDSGIPVFSYNANAIPVGALQRVEVLRDGAAALYGSDAVAGVVNNVLDSNFKGAKFDMQYGGAEGTGMRDFAINGFVGKDFAEGRGNFSLFAGYASKTKLYLNEQDYTATSDLSSYVAGTSFANVAAFNNNSTTTPWGSFRASGSGIITSNGVALTNASRQFHVQPTTNVGCRILTSTPGVCFDDGNGTSEMAGVDSNLRFNTRASDPALTTTPSVRRINIFSTAHYDLNDSLTLYGEAGFYRGETNANAPSGGSLATAPITVAANAYWNPLGVAGSVNRLPDLNISAAGLPVTITSLTHLDMGYRPVNVVNYQYRFLAGLKGNFGSWNYDTAALYNWATVRDSMISVSISQLQAAINRTGSDAYNPFNGGCVDTPSIGDCTANPAATVDSAKITSVRQNKTTLALWDFKLSNPELIGLWAGNSLGLATGVEVRRETYHDDRDSHQDGTIKYTDSVTGIVYDSDLLGASYSPDVRGKRTVWSAYAELALPLVSPEMNIPLIRSFDVQVAGRYEKYSDVGDIAKPKVAAAWDVVEGIRLRGSWSQGFRAPNLEVLNTDTLIRSGTGMDYVLCEADVRAGRIANFAGCNRSLAVQRQSGGNPNLKAEESTSWNVGAVLTPPLPDGFGNLTLTVDRWRIKQKNVIGLADFQNAMTLDYLMRTQGGSNPDVVRAAPTAADEALVAGTGLAAVGELLYVVAPFQNLLPVQVDGIDFNVEYRLRTGIGNFSINLNAAHLLKYDVLAAPSTQAIIDAMNSGAISSFVSVQGGGSVLRNEGQPRWRFSGSANFTSGPVEVGAYTQYLSDVYQNGVRNADGERFIIKGQTTLNLYTSYHIKQDGPLDNTSITLGVRNVFDKNPPMAASSLASNGGGYASTLYAAQARYWYVGLKKSF